MTTRAATASAAQEHLLSAAVDELLAVGGDSFTMQGVANRAEVALRTLYNHFPTREQLLADTFVRLAARARALIVEADDEAKNRGEQLAQFVERIYELFDDQGEPLTMLLALRGIAQLDDAVTEIRTWRRKRLTEILRSMDGEVELAVPLEEAVALAFATTAHATWHSLAIQSALGTPTAKRLAANSLAAAVFASRDGQAGSRRGEAAKQPTRRKPR